MPRIAIFLVVIAVGLLLVGIGGGVGAVMIAMG